LDFIKYSVGRGCAFAGNKFVFALLDWKYFNKSIRSFYVNHANDMGLTSPRASNSQTHMEVFFVIGGKNGRRWANQFNEKYKGQGIIELNEVEM
jgi:hypothetical protein